VVVHEVDGAKYDVIMHMAFINVRRQYIFILPFGGFISKPLSYFVRLFRRNFAGVKGLYQMMGKVAALVYCLGQGKAKLNISRFMGAAIRRNQDFFVGLGRIADIVKGFL
jgi:hypothetical protein